MSPGGGLEGGCACGQLRYRLLREPLFVHCCHCTRCQRETGGPFAHHAVIEWTAFEVTQGEPDYALVPTDSRRRHAVARCPNCRTALWNEWGAKGKAVSRYLRVGTLDEPGRCPPQAHIYVRSKQPWLSLADGAPQFARHYDTAKAWPAESLGRWEEAARRMKAR